MVKFSKVWKYLKGMTESMNIVLEDSINYRTGIKDFGVDPVNKRIIITGEKLVMLINFGSLKDEKAQAVTAMLKPLFGNLNTIIYMMK